MAVLAACVCSLLAGMGKSVVFAESSQPADTFSGDVVMLRQDNDRYVIQVTVENKGEDFTGTVQVIFANAKGNNCAYHTELDLPAQGKKQLTLNVSERAVDTIRGICALNFLDGKGRILQSIQLSDVFGRSMSGFPVGILSDDYSALTYLDAGGRLFTIQDMNYPLELVELNQDNLDGYLDGLYFLVIDRFNVSSLGEENIRAIQEWVEGGGWLLIGTGAYAEQTLSGFGEDFFAVDVLGISEPGEENFVSKEADRGSYYRYEDAGIDFTQMAIAELDYRDWNGAFYESSDHPAVCGSYGDGAAAIFYYSLGEEALQGMQSYMVYDMYQQVVYNSYSYQAYESDMDYVGRRALAYIDSSNTSVDFTWLEVLIAGYVILIGPILYLVLRKGKKSEWYWVGVPALGLVFIAGVFFFGQGARVKETKVYSVTVQRSDDTRADTYFLAYQSGVKEWDMQLKEDYDVGGPGWDGYYYRGGNIDVSDYYYAVRNDPQGMWIGLKPRENFESGYLYAGRRAESKGSFSWKDILASDSGGIAGGTVTNNTVCNLAYMAVWDGVNICVISDVKAGESVDLQQAIADGRCVYQNSISYNDYDRLLYDMVSYYGDVSELGYEPDDIAVLTVGIGQAMDAVGFAENFGIVAGVVRDYDKAVVSKCQEISYGCLYAYLEMEVGQHAAD